METIHELDCRLLKNRKVWFSPNCLSTYPYPHYVHFSTSPAVSGGVAGIVQEPDDDSFPMQCLPLYSLLSATNVTTVNYLSLDIEGAEFQVVVTY